MSSSLHQARIVRKLRLSVLVFAAASSLILAGCEPTGGGTSQATVPPPSPGRWEANDENHFVELRDDGTAAYSVPYGLDLSCGVEPVLSVKPHGRTVPHFRTFSSLTGFTTEALTSIGTFRARRQMAKLWCSIVGLAARSSTT